MNFFSFLVPGRKTQILLEARWAGGWSDRWPGMVPSTFQTNPDYRAASS